MEFYLSLVDNDLFLKRKFTFRANDRKLVLVKKPLESLRHVLMKALLWGLYLPDFPHLQVEVPIGDKYKPDLVETGRNGPLFWGEAGSIRSEKLRRILNRFPRTHFALAMWGADLAPLEKRARRLATNANRQAPLDIIRFWRDADRRFIDDRGRISVQHSDLEWRRIH